jgi:8-oxo-dGTP diphosphatase
MPIVHAAVKALVAAGDRYLLLKQDVGGRIFWDLPGGRIQFGESPEQALSREAKEELGQEIAIGRPLGAWWFFRAVDGDQVVCLTFLCSIADRDIRLPVQEGETIAGYEWVAKADLGRPEFASLPASLREMLLTL